LRDLRIAIFVPAFNAARTLPIVLDRIPPEIKERVEQVFVIDNNSSDQTYMTAVEYQRQRHMYKLKVFKNKQNVGYGGSQKIAYQYSIDQGFDVVVMLHGDAQYAPEKIAFLLEPFETGEADMVFGSRISGLPLKGGMPLHKFLGNKFLTFVQNKVLGTRLSEFHSGFRVFSCQALRQIPFTNCSDDYHFDTEIMIQFVAKGLRIVERPIPTYYGAEKCYVNVFSYGLNILAATLQYWVHKKGLRHYLKYDVEQTYQPLDYKATFSEIAEAPEPGIGERPQKGGPS